MRASCCVMVLAPDEISARAAQVREERPDHANRIDAGMLIEAAVFDGEHGLLDVRRNGRKRHPAAALPRRRRQSAQQRRIERHVVHARVADDDPRDDRRRGAGGAVRIGRRPLEAHGAAGVASAPRHHHDEVTRGRELAAVSRGLARRVAEVVQALHDIVAAERESRAQRERSTVDARNRTHAFALEARFDEQRELPVVVAGHAGGDEDGRCDRGGEDPCPAPAGEPPPHRGRPAQIVSTQ